jgi:hypothetical protein
MLSSSGISISRNLYIESIGEAFGKFMIFFKDDKKFAKQSFFGLKILAGKGG